MKWAIELNGVRQARLFDSPAEAVKSAEATWPATPEVILNDNDADDAPGWLVVPVRNGDNP